MKTVNYLDSIVSSYENGNISQAMSDIKKLSRSDRARIVSRFRCLISTQVAFEISDKIIRGDY
ncbi:hypothetical protein S144_8 [Shewanella sp. phage 1/44]|uniref:hypothetical protein n=1 Tax=Shewanella sp. phage 1/44 TaxID=1458862 RepID=UPI0004F66A7C|nr:hypothetical protein S144_8 [Shewanella sp. phage 1/44]AHK11723.1 hypothetical protein S144_8 [Shewanella sp. phage 1/44]